MDNISYDKLLKFVAYFIIVFVLSMILYLMYIDFLTETFFSRKPTSKEKYTDIDINKKIRYIDQISNQKPPKVIEKLTNQVNSLDTLKFDPSAMYLLKRDLINSENEIAITDALCVTGDITSNSGKTCLVQPNNFYLSNSGNNNFTVTVMPDGQSVSKNEISYYNYDINIVNITPNSPLSIVRQTNFFFPDNKNIKQVSPIPREFDNQFAFDMAIINYFDNYARYNNSVNLTLSNQLLTGTFNNSDLILIDTYFSYLTNLLLLRNSDVNTPFIYKSGYDFDVNDIKQNIIFLYSMIVEDPANTINVNLVINDTTSIKFYYDSPTNMTVYTFELIPNITIIFSKLILTFDPNMPKNISKSSFWALYYLTSLTANDDAPDITFIYNETVNFPIALPLAIPTINNWDTNTNNGILPYIGNIFNTNKVNISNLTITDPINPNVPVTTNGLALVTTNLSNFIKILGNTNLLKITDIFILYDPVKSYFEAWIITNLLDKHTNENIVCPLISFTAHYSPIECPKGSLYNNKCIPSCPTKFSYDLGLVCLNNNYVNYLPRSPMCNYVNSLNLPDNTIDPIIKAIKIGCDPDYFNQTKPIYQTDITQKNYTLPYDILPDDLADNVTDNRDTFSNTFSNPTNNIDKSSNRKLESFGNILHFTPFL